MSSSIDNRPTATPGVLRSQYRLVQQTLGEGSFAIVKLGVHLETGNKVAVKIIQRKRLAGKKEVYLFREVNILQKLNNAAIVKLLAFYDEADTFNLVMEYMEGGPLFERILSKRGGYSEKEARDSVENIIKAIQHCHENEIIHRDLKPENLLLPSLSDDLHIKLADFGLSVQDNGGKITGTAGSPLYMAPEIIRKEQYGKAVDMWSIGVITFIIISGEPPFYAETSSELYKITCACKINFSSNSWSSVSAEAKDFIRCLLTVNPADRLTANSAMQHPWLKCDEKILGENNLNENLANLRHFNAMQKFKSAVNCVIATNKFASFIEGMKAKTPRLLKDKYEILETLGLGSFAAVRLATKKDTSEKYALKIVQRKNTPQKFINFLHREVDIMKLLKHDNIVECYEFYDEPDAYTMVLEYMEGGELFDRIVKKVSYSEREARDVMKQIVSAIEYCHFLNIVHRDIKPENLLLLTKDNDESLKIADFGLAVIIEEGGTISGIAGSPLYMAPEIIDKVPYAKPVDMWSIGAVAYVLLGGYPPFYADSQNDIFKLIRKGEYTFEPLYWSGVSDEAKDFISKLLTTKPDKRMTASQALMHPWLSCEAGALASRDLKESLANIKKFNAKRKWRSAAKAVIAIKRFKDILTETAEANKLKRDSEKALLLKGREEEEEEKELMKELDINEIDGITIFSLENAEESVSPPTPIESQVQATPKASTSSSCHACAGKCTIM